MRTIRILMIAVLASLMGACAAERPELKLHDRARTFDVDRSNGRVLVPGPVVIAECLEL